jgi:hypothetical protein
MLLTAPRAPSATLHVRPSEWTSDITPGPSDYQIPSSDLRRRTLPPSHDLRASSSEILRETVRIVSCGPGNRFHLRNSSSLVKSKTLLSPMRSGFLFFISVAYHASKTGYQSLCWAEACCITTDRTFFMRSSRSSAHSSLFTTGSPSTGDAWLGSDQSQSCISFSEAMHGCGLTNLKHASLAEANPWKYPCLSPPPPLMPSLIRRYVLSSRSFRAHRPSVSILHWYARLTAQFSCSTRIASANALCFKANATEQSGRNMSKVNCCSWPHITKRKSLGGFPARNLIWINKRG